MTFTPEQTMELAAPLDRATVKQRTQAGRSLCYIEAWHAIAEANRIFGFDGWDRETVNLTETNRDLVTLKGQNGPYEQWRVGYLAKVRVRVGETVREGTGFGSGMAKPEALGEAIESAIKEAESDAMKRALTTFGNPFGLALYDKTQANVADAPPPEPVLQTSMTEGKDWWGCNGERGNTANAAKAADLDKTHDEFRQQLAAAATTEALGDLCRRMSPIVKTMPLSWRIELRADADLRAEELGANPNERRAA